MYTYAKMSFLWFTVPTSIAQENIPLKEITIYV